MKIGLWAGFGEDGFAERLGQKVIKGKTPGSTGGTTSTARLSAATTQTSRLENQRAHSS
jgi:hypothetical protein